MRFKSLAPPLALAFALGLGGAALAQDAEAESGMSIEDGAMMINGLALTAEQAASVQSYCDELQADFEAGTDSEPPARADQPVTFENFDFSQVTRDDCIEAGFIER